MDPKVWKTALMAFLAGPVGVSMFEQVLKVFDPTKPMDWATLCRFAFYGAIVGMVALHVRKPESKPDVDTDRFRGAGTGPTGLLLLLGVALMSTACASGQVGFRVGPEARLAGVDKDVVESLVCESDIKAAEDYCRRRVPSEADVTECVQRAKLATYNKPGCACRDKACVNLKDQAVEK